MSLSDDTATPKKKKPGQAFSKHALHIKGTCILVTVDRDSSFPDDVTRTICPHRRHIGDAGTCALAGATLETSVSVLLALLAPS